MEIEDDCAQPGAVLVDLKTVFAVIVEVGVKARDAAKHPARHRTKLIWPKTPAA